MFSWTLNVFVPPHNLNYYQNATLCNFVITFLYLIWSYFRKWIVHWLCQAISHWSYVWLRVFVCLFVSIRSGWMCGVEGSAAQTPTFWSMTSAVWRALSMSRWSDSKLWITGKTELIQNLIRTTSKNRVSLSFYDRSNTMQMFDIPFIIVRMGQTYQHWLKWLCQLHWQTTEWFWCF